MGYGRENEHVIIRTDYPELSAQLAQNATQLNQTQANVLTGEMAVKRSNRKKQALVTFIDDDGQHTAFDVIKPIALAKNIPYCAALYNTSQILRDKLPELLDLQINHGWEFMAHTTAHTNLTTHATAEEVEADVKGNKEFMESKGLKVESIAYPFGGNNAMIRDVCSKYFRTGHLAGAPTGNTYPLNSMAIQRYPLGGTGKAPEQDTLDYYKSLVDTALANKQWLVLMTHAFQNTVGQNQMLSDVIDYVKSKSIPIVTVKTAHELIGNSVEVRDQVGVNNFVVDCEGLIESNSTFEIKLAKTGITNDLPVTSYPNNKVSHVQFLIADGSGFPEQGAGTLITNRLNIAAGDATSYQLFLPYNNSRIYRRNWGAGSWGAWSYSITSADYIPTSWTGLVALINTSFRQLGLTKVTNYVDFEKVVSSGGTQPALSKTLWSVSEISTDSANPTVIGTAGAVSLQVYRDVNNFVWAKYSAAGNNYSAYFKTAFC